MKKIIFLILIVSFLSGCSVDWNGEKDKKITEKDNQITELENQIKDLQKEKESDLFKKKQECVKYQDKIIEELKNPDFIMKELDPVVEQIFYSPMMKTCLYSFRYLKGDYCNRDDLSEKLSLECLHKDKSIVDFFTKEEVYSSIKYDNCMKNGNFDTCISIDAKIKELKGE